MTQYEVFLSKTVVVTVTADTKSDATELAMYEVDNDGWLWINSPTELESVDER